MASGGVLRIPCVCVCVCVCVCRVWVLPSLVLVILRDLRGGGGCKYQPKLNQNQRGHDATCPLRVLHRGA